MYIHIYMWGCRPYTCTYTQEALEQVGPGEKCKVVVFCNTKRQCEKLVTEQARRHMYMYNHTSPLT